MRLALGGFVAFSAVSMPLENVADALESARSLELVSASFIPDAPEPGQPATTPAKLCVAELEKDGSNKTKKVHSAFVAAIAEADGLRDASASPVLRALEAERRRSAGSRHPRRARAPPRAA